MEYCGEVLTTALFHKRTVEYSKTKAKHFYFMSLKSNEVLHAYAVHRRFKEGQHFEIHEPFL
jgi:hypothetical protein